MEVDGAHVYVKLDMAGFIRGWWNYFTNNGSSTARIAIGTISAGSDAIYLNHMFSQGQFAAKTNVVSKKDFEHFIAVEMKGLVRNSLGSSTPVLSDISQAIKGAQDAWASRVERAWAAAPRDRSLGVALVALPDGSVRSVRRPGLDPSGAKNAYGDALLSHVPGSRVFFPLNQALTPSPSELEVAFLNQFRALAEKELAPGLLTQTLNKLQTVLDVAGMVPALGAIPDLINGGISTARGDKYAASLSFLAVVPAFGDAAGLAKIAKTAEKAIDATKLTDESAMVLKASLAAIADPDQLARAERAAKANVLEAVASGKLQSSTLTQVLGEEAADGILFGQKRIAENFRLYSEAPDFIRGRSIAAVAADLKTGKISPNSLPISYFVWEGKKVAISNRGLAALAEAGMKPTVVKEVPLNEVPVKILRRLDEIPIFRGQTIPGRMIAVTLDKAGTEVLRIITLPD